METSENARVRIGFDWDGNLSDGDKEFIATLYPTKEGNTIQAEWVHAGYFFKFPYCENPDLDITSSVFEVSSLQYLIDKPTNSRAIWTVNLHKSLQFKVSADLIAQAAAKNIKFEFLY